MPVLDRAGALIAVLDVDSDTPAAFDEADAAALEAIMRGGVRARQFARVDIIAHVNCSAYDTAAVGRNALETAEGAAVRAWPHGNETGVAPGPTSPPS